MEQASIRQVLERVCSLIDRRPGYGQATEVSVSTLLGAEGGGSALRCRTDAGPWHFDTDLPRGLGGSASGPTPGVLGRAALGSCLAIGYALRAAARGVELTSVRVTVEGDSHVAGMLLLDAEVPPGYTEIRYHVEVQSPSDEDDVRVVMDEADRLSPLLDVFTRANAVQRTLTVRSVEPEPPARPEPEGV